MRKRTVVMLAFGFAFVAVIGPSQARDCRGLTENEPLFGGSPRVVTEVVHGNLVNVLLPSDYQTSERRYPTLYLLHGWTMNHDSWLLHTDIEAFTGSLADEDAAIVVMPYGNGFGVDIDHRDGSVLWETFYVRQLIPFIDSRYRTIADGAHRAIAGLSGGAITAMPMTARHPGLFAAVGGFSGLYDLTPGSPLGEIALFPIERAITVCFGGSPTGPGAIGDPIRDDLWWHAFSAAGLAGNLRGTSVYFSWGSGLPCDQTDVRDMLSPPSTIATAWQNLEAGSAAASASFEDALTEAGIPHHAVGRSCGIHSWRYWELSLHEFWPQMIDAFGSAPPDVFDFKTADAPENRRAPDGTQLAIANEAWGWTFLAGPTRAAEFLTVTEASAAGLVLTGSGVTTVTTAGYFAAGQPIALSGAVEPNVFADSEGRITFHVDLGPAHTLQQYTLQQRVAEATAGDAYWTTRAVTFG